MHEILEIGSTAVAHFLAPTGYRMDGPVIPDPGFVENRYNLLQREVEETVLPICREREIGFLAYSPLASGLLTGKYGGESRHPRGR